MENGDGLVKKDIKEQIFEQTLRLYNERGYQNVSLREIAQALDISVGNLTYHFPKKEDLLIYLVKRQHLNYKKTPIPRTLGELNRYFSNNVAFQERNLYYFRDFNVLSQIYPEMLAYRAQVMHDRRELLMRSLECLRADEMLLPEPCEGQQEALVSALIIVLTYWKPYCALSGELIRDNGLLSCLWGILYPCLTDDGKAVFAQGFPVDAR